MEFLKKKLLVNPYGVIFNPPAIEQAFHDLASGKKYTESDLYFHNGLWLSLNHHTCFSAMHASVVIKKINNQLRIFKNALEEASHIFITLGTSWVYRFLASGKMVANCHNIPQREFKKELLSVNQIVKILNVTLSHIHKLNNTAQVIFTISPIRHLKDGVIENQLSKAHLISAVHSLVSSNNNCSYFPSYEIIMDDLRDYRFYEEDLIHPNSMAISYIWEKFKGSLITNDSLELMEKIDAIQKRMAHIPFNPESDDHKNFIKDTEKLIAAITANYPDITF